MADYIFSDTQAQIKVVSYTGGTKDTEDLEAGTATIVPTSQPAIGDAQYKSILTLATPDNALLAIVRIAARLSVTIGTLGEATSLSCAVRVDVDDADHELFTENWDSNGAKLDAVDTHAANKATIFNLLKDGAAHTFYFLFWAQAADQATVTLVQLQYGVGSCGTTDTYTEPPNIVMSLTFTSEISGGIATVRYGSGNLTFRVSHASAGTYLGAIASGGPDVSARGGFGTHCVNNVVVGMFGTVATDINNVELLHIVLMTSQ